MIFDQISFIKSTATFDPRFTGKNIAPMFRKKFYVKAVNRARLYVCGLGYGYYYINGKSVSEDLFTAPVGDYRRTLWYNAYDVAGLLQAGENVMAVVCGNGWYNEEFASDWNYDKAEWRDQPKFILRLDVDGETVLKSDADWKCCRDSGTYFNALRSGEYFDANRYNPEWTTFSCDDSSWENVQVDLNPPGGIFRECQCEPIRACERLEPVEVIRLSEKKQVLDFGRNISGYVHLDVTGEPGAVVTIRYAEQLKSNCSRQLNDMERYYKGTEFQTDRFVCSGKRVVWSPKFTYHGFRYAEIEGIKLDHENQAKAVYVHQAVENRTDFQCSNEFLNKLFEAGKASTLSNMFYMMTDCPTREKLGWANDAQASMEQILTNFKAERVMEKWLQDIYDAIREDGALPGIIPTAGWGYHWGNGPVSDGVLFEIPYRIYLHTGNREILIESLPYFEKYLSYLQIRTDADGFVRFGLPDWSSPGSLLTDKASDVPVELINALLMSQFYEVAAIAAELAGKVSISQLHKEHSKQLLQLVRNTYINGEGKCVVERQTAVAMMIYYEVAENQEPLKEQLVKLIEEAEFRHDCGMVGLRRLYMALNKCGLQEYALKIITAKGYPGYGCWFDRGATTLWEHWDYEKAADSKNHHMYSDVLSWMVKTILGIRMKWGIPGFLEVYIDPYFFQSLEYVKGSCDTCRGKIKVAWKRAKNYIDADMPSAGGTLSDNVVSDSMLSECIELTIWIPEGMKASFRGKELVAGFNKLIVYEKEGNEGQWNATKW